MTKAQAGCWGFAHSSSLCYSIFCPVNIKFTWNIFSLLLQPKSKLNYDAKSTNIPITSKQLLLQHASMLFSAALNLHKTVGSYYLLSAFPFFPAGTNYAALVVSVVLRCTVTHAGEILCDFLKKKKKRNVSLQLWNNCCKEHPRDKSSQKAPLSL